MKFDAVTSEGSKYQSWIDSIYFKCFATKKNCCPITATAAFTGLGMRINQIVVPSDITSIVQTEFDSIQKQKSYTIK